MENRHKGKDSVHDMAGLVIRDYKRGDYTACRALWEELTAHHREICGDPKIGGDDPGQGFDAYLANPLRRASWVAEVRGNVAGLTGLLVNGMEGEMEPLVVSSRYRSRGIGTALVTHVVEQAKRMGIRCVTVQPVAQNKQAIAFLVRQGV